MLEDAVSNLSFTRYKVGQNYIVIQWGNEPHHFVQNHFSYLSNEKFTKEKLLYLIWFERKSPKKGDNCVLTANVGILLCDSLLQETKKSRQKWQLPLFCGWMISATHALLCIVIVYFYRFFSLCLDAVVFTQQEMYKLHCIKTAFAKRNGTLLFQTGKKKLFCIHFLFMFITSEWVDNILR